MLERLTVNHLAAFIIGFFSIQLLCANFSLVLIYLLGLLTAPIYGYFLLWNIVNSDRLYRIFCTRGFVTLWIEQCLIHILSPKFGEPAVRAMINVYYSVVQPAAQIIPNPDPIVKLGRVVNSQIVTDIKPIAKSQPIVEPQAVSDFQFIASSINSTESQPNGSDKPEEKTIKVKISEEESQNRINIPIQYESTIQARKRVRSSDEY